MKNTSEILREYPKRTKGHRTNLRIHLTMNRFENRTKR